jgi:hypothetical protein
VIKIALVELGQKLLREAPLPELYFKESYKRSVALVTALENRRQWQWKERKPKSKPTLDRYWKMFQEKYGITFEQLEAMHRAQGGKCANPGCRSPIDLLGRERAIDHCHKTGRIRGMLCRNCNQALGLVYDEIKRLEGLASYLRRTDDYRAIEPLPQFEKLFLRKP